ncbi:MAG: iron-containing alcohol dehydrogenase [Thermodesulfobacteriota bacterium]|nr:iron-containing alcohol dehydrogenase [Thermodesulfobacteriota bacterium]
MERYVENARKMLFNWKGNSYSFGFDVLSKVGELAGQYGKKALLIVADLEEAWTAGIQKSVSDSLKEKGVAYEAVTGARPNAPREDVYRLALHVARSRPDVIICVGGGSTIDAAKAANVLSTYSPADAQNSLAVSAAMASTVDPYFGVGNVSKVKNQTNQPLLPLVAVQTAASSGAHLTKYSNITDLVTGQKKLIVDEAIVPQAAVFDYGVTLDSPLELTLDGGLDGIAHAWEVFMGATGQPYYTKMKEVARACLRLIVSGLPKVKTDARDRQARLCLGLGTDLGGYSIMLGGTSGPHLGSFSLIDVLSHGRACAILNPYYTVLFAPRIQDQLTVFAEILKEGGFVKARTEGKKGRALAMLVARGMIQFSKSLGFPATLAEAGVSKAHLKQMIQAAKDPQLKMKLQNMPTPMEAERGDVDRLMKPTLEAAFTGNLDLIPQE